MSVQGFWY